MSQIMNIIMMFKTSSCLLTPENSQILRTMFDTQRYGFDEWAAVNSSMSKRQPEASSVPQGYALGSIPFSMFVNDTDSGNEHIFSTKLSGAIDSLHSPSRES